MTDKQIKMVRALMHKANVFEHRHDIAWSFSDETTTHLERFTQKQTEAIVKHLRGLIGQTENPSDKMRRKILSYAHEMHWELIDGRVDMERLNNWLIKYSPQKKRLDEFSSKELAIVVSQVEILYKDFLKGI